jgi:hypothetical protein
MSRKLKVFSEKNYTQIINEVGPFRYAIYDRGETVPGDIFSRVLAIEDYNCVVAGTGSTLSLCTLTLPYSKQVVIPKNSPVIVVRLLRADNARGEMHYNADDQIVFPTIEGDIFRLPRKDAPDHYITIAGTANMLTLADAYQLPDQKSGPIAQYSAKGARLYVDLNPK